MQEVDMNYFTRDFMASTRKALRIAGIAIVGIQMVPSAQGWINAEKAYILDDHGTAKVRTYKQISDGCF